MGPAHHGRTHPFARGARHIGDIGVLDAVDGPQRPLDLAGVDGRATDLEHVVGSAVVEKEPVLVEVAEVAGGVEAVAGKQLLAAATADAPQHVWSADLDRANGSRRNGLAVVGVDDADLRAGERLSAAAPRCRRDSRSTARTLRSCRTAWPARRVGPAARAEAELRGCSAATPKDRHRPCPRAGPMLRPDRANRETA